MSHDPLTPMERSLLEQVNRMNQETADMKRQIAELQGANLRLNQRVDSLEKALQRVLPLWGQAFLPSNST
ncbi:hypothetical protein [Defluviimonas salinarum]|uniref:Uncharacterized protein n=1 Tax=Defluviimonas salinarum TaxID=2992147 RepID=A0ABT3JAN6_9RHOB|nr:hypothetical protein [Defluviimonas salinarum]MCW3784756.1 hypothetical protein [Defluviimonas salinarum]